MLQVVSEWTKQPEPCTIQPGVVGADGVRRGAMADIDCFAMFNWEDAAGNDVDPIRVYMDEKSRRVVEVEKRELTREERVALLADHYAGDTDETRSVSDFGVRLENGGIKASYEV